MLRSKEFAKPCRNQRKLSADASSLRNSPTNFNLRNFLHPLFTTTPFSLINSAKARFPRSFRQKQIPIRQKQIPAASSIKGCSGSPSKCIRLNLTTNPDNKVEIEKPERYDPRQYELLIGNFQNGRLKKVGNVLALYGMPGAKRECNNKQAAIVSMSMPGVQTAWAEATFEERAAIHRRYRDYTHGLLWFMKSDPRIPKAVREEMASYGFCKDE